MRSAAVLVLMRILPWASGCRRSRKRTQVNAKIPCYGRVGSQIRSKFRVAGELLDEKLVLEHVSQGFIRFQLALR